MLRGCYRKRYLLSALFFIFLCSIFCRAAISEETAYSTHKAAAQTDINESGANSSHEKDRSADLLDLLYRFINFTLLVIILFVFIKKARLMDYLSVRSDDIHRKFEDLKKEKEEAETKYRDIEGRLKDFEAKRRDILEEYRKEGLAEKDKIIFEATERVKQIIEQSEVALEQEIRSARNRLKQEIVELAIGQATDIIQKEINEKDHDDLINEFIERVGRIN